MELELTKITYGKINTILSNCLKLVPIGCLSKQKIAIGDVNGNFQLYEIKKSQAHLVFQYYVGTKVSSIQISGIPGSTLDKIFVSSDTIVNAFTKKGKIFLSFDTNLAEPIKHMFVFGADLLICGNHVYGHYKDCKDVGSYICGDTIVDVAAVCPNNTNRIFAILACSGRVLRILEHCRVRQTVELDSVPSVLHVPKNLFGDRIICGFADGKVILYQFSHLTGEISQKILVDAASSASAVTCIDTYDLSGDGYDDLIIGRRNGTIQVFTMATNLEIDFECRQTYRESFPESISAVKGGCIYSHGCAELVILLYSGKIVGLTTNTLSVSLGDNKMLKQPLARTHQEKISRTSNLISNSSIDDNILTNLVKPFESYQLDVPIENTSTPDLQVMHVNDSLNLDKMDNAYNLFIEMPTSIAEVMLESEAMIQSLSTDNNEYTIENMSMSEVTFLNKIRMVRNSNRLEFKFQTTEGQYGSLQAFITPLKPPNIQTRSYLIKPLSLHFRIHKFDSTRPLNVLSLKGEFSFSEMHNWVYQCIPEVPERLSTTSLSIFFFENTLIGTILECKYGKGYGYYRSDNLSTISILKDFLTKEATRKRIKLEMKTDISELSVAHVIQLFQYSIMERIIVNKEHNLLQALLQVDVRNDADFECLMPEYRSILKRRTEIETKFKNSATVLNKYFGLMTNFYIHRFKFKGIFVEEKIPQLLEILEQFNFAKLNDFFYM